MCVCSVHPEVYESNNISIFSFLLDFCFPESFDFKASSSQLVEDVIYYTFHIVHKIKTKLLGDVLSQMQLSGKKRLCFLLGFQSLTLLSVVDKKVVSSLYCLGRSLSAMLWTKCAEVLRYNVHIWNAHACLCIVRFVEFVTL